jgi:hypothetical protein
MSADDDRPMTKGEAREWLRRIREDVRDAERALIDGDLDGLRGAMEDASGSAGELMTACDERGVRGLGGDR